jgi:hypothetical protein
MPFMGGVVASKYEFMEELPPCCPPDTAVLKGYAEAWRFVTSNTPVASDFRSGAAIKAAPPNVDPCRWASCSIFTTKDAAIATITKLPKLRARFGFLAKISITEKCGFTDLQGFHIDFWRFKTYVPNVLEVEAI